MSVNLNTNHSNSGVYTSNNINSTNTNENNENSLEFDEVLEQSQNINDDIQISKEALELLNSSNLAKEIFEKALRGIQNLADYETGEKIDFNSLSEQAQKDLFEHLSLTLTRKERILGKELEIESIKIQTIEGRMFPWNVYKTEDGEIIDTTKTDSLKYGVELIADGVPLGDEDTHKSAEELMKEYYLEGKTDNLYGFFKRQAEKNGDQNALDGYKRDEEEFALYKEAKEKYGIDVFSYDNLDITLPDGRRIIRNKIELPPLSTENLLYTQAYNKLLEVFFNNQNISNSNPTYAQINEIKNSSLKQEDTMLKQALNLN